MKKLSFSFLAIILLVGLYFLSFKKGAGRSLSSVTESGGLMSCKVLAVSESGVKTLTEERVLKEEDLKIIDKNGFKGVYFDIQGTGGFVVYSEQGGTVVETEKEGLGVLGKHIFSSLPFSQSLDIEIEAYLSKGVRIDVKKFILNCEILRSPHIQ